jgi:hypothetical protein
VSEVEGELSEPRALLDHNGSGRVCLAFSEAILNKGIQVRAFSRNGLLCKARNMLGICPSFLAIFFQASFPED